MNLTELEKYRDKILTISGNEKSPRLLLSTLNEFLSTILKSKQIGLLEAYFSEYINEYLSLITNLDPAGIHPNSIKELIANTNELRNAEAFESNSNNIEEAILSLKEKYQKIEAKLVGENTRTSIEEITFPILEKGKDGQTNFGFLERISISVKSRHGIEKDKFIIVPSFGKLDSRLNRQILTSWKYAKQIILKSKKSKYKFYEVVIQFDKKYGIYEGDSLGIALTVGFIQELVRFHNLRELVNIKGNIVSTGSVSETGEVGSVSKIIIEKKLVVVFFSEADIFIVSEKDKVFADEQFIKLKEDFPLRKLNIVAVSSVEDLISRRNLVEIKKQNAVKWAAKKTYNNKPAVAAILLLIIISSYFFVKDIDQNPKIVEFKDKSVFAKNKYGKVLWSISPANYFPEYAEYNNYYERFYKLKYNSKNLVNEIYLCGIKDNRSLYKLDFSGNELWSYTHKEVIETDSEVFNDIFNIKSIVGIVSSKNDNEAAAIVQHASYYPSAIIKVNSQTGELKDSVFWHPGAIDFAFVQDIDGDGKLELVGQAISNGYKCVAFFALEYDKLNGTAPAPIGYKIKNRQIADFEWYILIPKTDYGEYHYPKYNTLIDQPKFEAAKGFYAVSTIESGVPSRKKPEEVRYDFALDFNDVEIIINDSFAIDRDKLVNAGVLQKPYSDTREYREILKRQLLIWNGKEFIQMFPESFSKN